MRRKDWDLLILCVDSLGIERVIEVQLGVPLHVCLGVEGTTLVVWLFHIEVEVQLVCVSVVVEQNGQESDRASINLVLLGFLLNASVVLLDGALG